MIENKVDVSWSLVSLQSLVAGSEDCQVRVEMLSVRSLSSQQSGELKKSKSLSHRVSQCHSVTVSLCHGVPASPRWTSLAWRASAERSPRLPSPWWGWGWGWWWPGRRSAAGHCLFWSWWSCSYYLSDCRTWWLSCLRSLTRTKP